MPLRCGQAVRIEGLAHYERSHLNGQSGVLVRREQETGRWRVRLEAPPYQLVKVVPSALRANGPPPTQQYGLSREALRGPVMPRSHASIYLDFSRDDRPNSSSSSASAAGASATSLAKGAKGARPSPAARVRLEKQIVEPLLVQGTLYREIEKEAPRSGGGANEVGRLRNFGLALVREGGEVTAKRLHSKLKQTGWTPRVKGRFRDDALSSKSLFDLVEMSEDQRYQQWFTGELSASTWSGEEKSSFEPFTTDDMGSSLSGSQHFLSTSRDSQILRGTSRDNRDIRNHRFGQDSLRYQQLYTREQPQWPQWEDGDTEQCLACTRLLEQDATAPKKVVSPLRVETPVESLAAVFEALPPLGHKLPSYQRKARGEATASSLERFPPAAALDLGLTLDLRESEAVEAPPVDTEGGTLEAWPWLALAVEPAATEQSIANDELGHLDFPWVDGADSSSADGGNGSSADGGNGGQEIHDLPRSDRQVGPKEEMDEEALIEREFEEYEQESRPATARAGDAPPQKLGDSAEGWDFEDDDGRP